MSTTPAAPATTNESCVTLCASREELDALLQRDGDSLLLVDFYAKWCGPCRAIAPKLEDMARNYLSEGLTVAKVDIDQVSSAPPDFGVSMMPTFVFFRQGQELARVVGADLNKLRRTLLDFLQDKQ